MKTDILGVQFDNLTLADAVERGVRLVSEHRAAYVVTPNPEIVMKLPFACGRLAILRKLKSGD